MILNARFQRPVISFGLSLTMLSCEIGDDVTVYVNDVYNENEFVLVQNEIQEGVIFRYIRTSNSEIKTVITNPFGEYNDKPIYFLNINSQESGFHEGGAGLGYVVFRAAAQDRPAQWVFCEVFTFINGAESPFLSILQTTSEMPLSQTVWGQGSGGGNQSFQMLSSLPTINNQSFTFPATESKDIQIQMRKKTGELLLSNKIQLTVNTSE